MKNLKEMIIIVGLLLVGAGSVFVYNQQQENRISEFESYEIAMLEDKVAELYNADKTDLSKKISEEQISEVGRLIDGKTNENLINDFGAAQGMFKLQSEIHKVFEDDSHKIAKADISLNKVSNLENELENFKDKTLFYERNSEQLQIVYQQIEDIEVATEFVERLFEDDESIKDLTEEDIGKAENLINKIKNPKIKSILLERIGAIEIIVEEPEVDDQLEEMEDEIETVEEVDSESTNQSSGSQDTRPPASTPNRPNQPPARPGTTRPETTEPAEDSDPEPKPDPKPEPEKPKEPKPEPDPEPEPNSESVEPEPEPDPTLQPNPELEEIP